MWTASAPFSPRSRTCFSKSWNTPNHRHDPPRKHENAKPRPLSWFRDFVADSNDETNPMLMTMMAVTRKEFRQIARDRRTLLILLFVPAFILLIFGCALNFDIRH